MLVWPAKDPDETVVRHINWENHPSWERYDTISSATFTLSTAAGMAIADSDTDNNHVSRVTLSGGADGSVGKVLAQVVTNDGQTLQWTAKIKIESR